ncbi:MAG: PTS transporter subunit EIIA [Lentisphaerae bacterium]|jgi:PTS system nitrogen regulatory IIA component|nr:PTS transporter subunit EIIA [Lentisphaerota bacterium]
MYLSLEQVARLLNVPERSVRRWMRKQKIPAFRVQDQYRASRADVLEWATARKLDISPDLFPESESINMPSLARAIEVGGIHHHIAGEDRASVLRMAVGRLALPEDTNRDALAAILLAREERISTGIGDGIAIPHARNPIILNVSTSSVALCFLDKPVEFGAPDGQPVQALFLVLAQTIRAHLYLLSRLASALRQESLRALVRQQADTQSILKAFQGLATPQPSGVAGL